MPHNQIRIGDKLIQFPEEMSLEEINTKIAEQKKRAEKVARILADLADKPESLVKIAGKLDEMEKAIKRIDTFTPTEASTKQMLRAIQDVGAKVQPAPVVDFTEILAAVKGIKIPKPRAEKKPKGIKIIREEGVITEGRFIF